MIKKKRYKRNTLGKLELYFKKEPYTGYINLKKFYFSTNINNITYIFKQPKIKHYKCYKKKYIIHPLLDLLIL